MSELEMLYYLLHIILLVNVCVYTTPHCSENRQKEGQWWTSSVHTITILLATLSLSLSLSLSRPNAGGERERERERKKDDGESFFVRESRLQAYLLHETDYVQKKRKTFLRHLV